MDAVTLATIKADRRVRGVAEGERDYPPPIDYRR
jgi:hypothetical protein